MPILGLSALFAVPYAIAVQTLAKGWTGDRILAPLLRSQGYAAPPTPESMVTRTILVSTGLLFLGALIYCALVRVADLTWRGEAPAMGKSLVWSLRRLFAVSVTGLIVAVAATVLAGIVLTVVLMVLGIIVTIMGEAAIMQSEVAQIVIGLSFFILAGLLSQVACVSFLFVPQVMVVEGKGYFSAIGRSFALVWSRFFRSVTVMWTAVGLWFALSLVAQLPSFLWETAVGQSGAALVGAAARGILGILLFPLVPLMSTAAYYDFRLRSEGFDLAERIGQLEGEGRHG